MREVQRATEATEEVMSERRAIPGFAGYMATSAGSVLNAQGRRLAGSLHHHGHLRVELSGGRRAFVHVLVALAFHGRPRRRGLVVRHLDGNARNNRPENLRWGTQRQNVLDSIRHGTHRGFGSEKRNRPRSR